jgi:hypothetical protein
MEEMNGLKDGALGVESETDIGETIIDDGFVADFESGFSKLSTSGDESSEMTGTYSVASHISQMLMKFGPLGELRIPDSRNDSNN